MTVHAFATKPAPTEITASEAARQYSKYLESKSYCIDESAWPLKALHINSNTDSSIDSFRYDFPAFAKSKGIRVEGSYSNFLQSLTDRLAYLLPRVKATSFRPEPKKIFINQYGLKCANTYAPFHPVVPEVFVMPAILEDYLSRVFMNDQDRKYVTQWLADIVQNPTRRVQWAVVLTGEQGSGKSSIFRLLSAALGGRHIWDHNQYAPAFEKFSEVLPDNLLVSFDDAPAARDTYQKLKQNITRATMPVQLKGIQKQVSRDVYARILICSNSPRPLVIEQGDRRLYVAEPSQHKESEEETAEFFVGFNELLEQPDTPAIIYHWLKSIDLSDFVHGSTIKTETHEKMVGLSSSVLETLLAEYVAELPIFHDKNLQEYLTDNGCKNANADLIKMKMASLNYEQKRRTIAGCGDKQQNLWSPICKRARALTRQEAELIKSVVPNPVFENP